MRIAIGSDHGGFEQKQQFIDYLRGLGHDVIDLGPSTSDSVDYPEYGAKVAHCVADGAADRGICICGTGIGISVAADKVPGVRASSITSVPFAHLFREHNNGNVIGLSGRFVSYEDNRQIVDEFLSTEFAGGRHARRVHELAELDRENTGCSCGAFDPDRVTIINHPMVQHKLTILRDEQTGSKQFRELVKELALFEGYEATRDFPLEDVRVTTPICETTGKQIAGRKVAIVPILRAGLGMVDGMLELIPAARVGHLGMYRDEETHQPHEYYAKVPADIEQRTCLVVDPMLATGGSATAAIHYLRERGVKDIRLLVLIAAPEGIQAVLDFDPAVRIFTCAVDEKLNENAYIVPGLGDAGDRIFGTK